MQPTMPRALDNRAPTRRSGRLRWSVGGPWEGTEQDVLPHRQAGASNKIPDLICAVGQSPSALISARTSRPLLRGRYRSSRIRRGLSPHRDTSGAGSSSPARHRRPRAADRDLRVLEGFPDHQRVTRIVFDDQHAGRLSPGLASHTTTPPSHEAPLDGRQPPVPHLTARLCRPPRRLTTCTEQIGCCIQYSAASGITARPAGSYNASTFRA
jgi:hypothetical protein